MNMISNVLLHVVVSVSVSLGCIGCSGGSHSSTSAPASGLNVNGYWEGVLSDGTPLVCQLSQTYASVTSHARIRETGQLVGTLRGYRMDFTFTNGQGDTETGQGVFDSAGSTFTANLPSVGNFQLSWRGTDFEHHEPL